MEEETASGSCFGIVGAPDTRGYSLAINGSNGDTLIGYSDQRPLAEIES
jgi:hypothetical protein